MNKIILLSIFGFSLILTGCTQSTVQPAQKQQALTEEFRVEAVAEKNDGYTLKYPNSWFIENEPNELDVILSPQKFDLVQKPGNEHNSVFLVSVSSKTTSPNELAEKLKIIFQKGSPSAEISIDQLTLNGFIAARVDVKNVNVASGLIVPTGFSNNNPGFQGNYTELIVDGPITRFRLFFTYLKDDEASRKTLNEIVQSFTILP